MNPANRDAVGKFLAQAKPCNKGWIEDRLIFEADGKIIQITDNYPHWTISQVLDFVKSVGLPYRRVKVQVTPIFEEDDLYVAGAYVTEGSSNKLGQVVAVIDDKTVEVKWPKSDTAVPVAKADLKVHMLKCPYVTPVPNRSFSCIC